MFNSLQQHLNSEAWVLFSNSAVKVHDSQAYRNMEITREHISFTFDPRDILLSLQMGFSFVRTAVACAILERISGLVPSSEQLLQGTWSLLQCPASVLLPLSLCGYHRRFLSSVWFFSHWSPSYTLCRFCWDFLLGLLTPALPQLEHLCRW